MIACTEPGCTGTYEDGYCNVCGSPQAATAGAAAPASATSLLGTGVAQASPDRAAAAADPDAERSTRTGRTSSSRLATAALGSARTVATGGSRPTRRVGTSSTRLRGARLGAGLTTVPAAPVQDPLQAVMAVAEVPERKRFCPACGAEVGRVARRRARPDRRVLPEVRQPVRLHARARARATSSAASTRSSAASRTAASAGSTWRATATSPAAGWCSRACSTPGDPDAYAAAISERQFLAEVEHPLIVEIYNFAMHEGAGYTVMEFVGGRSLKQILQDRRDAAGGVNTPAAGGPGARVRPRDPARVRLPARRRPAVLRLQAGQRHPAGRRGQAHRPRRRAPDRRPGLGDLRHGRLPGARGGRGRAVRGVGHLHDRPHPGHAGARLPRQHQHLRGVAAGGRRTPRCSRRTTRSTGCWPRRARSTRRTGSRRSTSCARRSSACCARSSPPTAGRAARRCTRPRPSCSRRRRPTRPATRWPGTSCPRSRSTPSDPAASWLAGVNVSDPAAAHRARWTTRPRTPSRCGCGGRPRRSRRATSDCVDRHDRADPRGRPVGVAGRLAGRARAAEHRRPGRGARVVQRRLRAGARRAGAEARAGHRVRAAAASRTSRSRSTSSARAPTPTTRPRPRSGWPGSAARAATCAARSRALDLVTADAQLLRGRPDDAGAAPGARRAATSRRCPTRWRACRPSSIEPRVRGRAPGRRAGLGARGRAATRARRRPSRSGGVPAQEPELRDALEAALRRARRSLNDEPRRADRAGRPGQRGPSVDHVVTCAACGTVAEDGSKFCEHCGTPLGAVDPAPRDRGGRPGASPRRLPVCRACGGTIADDGYCESCGEPAVSERDHWSERPSALVGGVCDRGRRKSRNEDAMALGAQRADAPSSWSATGCRTCPDSDVASLAAARAARDVLVAGARRAAPSARGRRSLVTRRGRGRPGHRRRRRGHDRPRTSRRRARSSPPSSTARPSSPAGWATRGCTGCPTTGPRIQVSVDDSGRQRDDRARRAAGQGRGVAARAHAITRWLGPDAETVVPRHRHHARAGTRLGARLLGRPVELLLRGHRRRRPAAPHRRAGRGPRPTSSPPSSSAGRTSRAGTTTSPRRWPASQHPSILSTPTRPYRPTPAPPAADRGATVAEFRTEVFQNEFLSDGATDVHAIVTVTSSGAGTAADQQRAASRRSSSSTPPGRCSGPNIDAAKYAAQVAVDQIADGTWFAIIGGSHVANRAFPYPNAPVAIVQMEPGAREEAKRAISYMRPSGGTAMSTWLRLADAIFAEVPQVAQKHAILLTDGRNESEPRAELSSGDLRRHRALPVRRARRRLQLGGGRAARDRDRAAGHRRPDPQPGGHRGGLQGAGARVDVARASPTPSCASGRRRVRRCCSCAGSPRPSRTSRRAAPR